MKAVTFPPDILPGLSGERSGGFVFVIKWTKIKAQRLAELFCRGTRLAGVVGIEPTSKVLETPILPLNHTPTVWCAIRDSNPGPTGYEPVALTN